MLVGATGVGKSTLINTMINYILGVKWEDDFRFKIVDKRVEGPQSQAHSQTQVIAAYTIHSNEHHTIPYTLTIIDTPGFGDTRGIERDKAIVHQVKEFFSHPEDHHVDHLDALGFVTNSSKIRFDYTQKYIFHSILSLYGKDIEPNIVILATFSDKEPLQVVSAFKEENIRCEGNLFKFNNSALFECNVAEGGSDSDEDDLLVNHHMQCLQSLNSEAASCMQRLQEIALKPQISVKEYVDMLIEQEKNGPTRLGA
ncbi:uncharacterized protein LOC110981926 [Acanthaster planci]|uniref:Uncharacterized protein LOC110981926 n=1 Tax=Acanthaster planci TaxID=133434 RepID=A0A8B7YQV8_ACAPL|nr:uncharacterized protein LOC110981926 [Acanthaster planci]